MGLTAKKAWAFAGSGGLQIKQLTGESVSWWYHVAASLPVKTPDGSLEDMVFDPGLFDGPVSLEEWGDAMKAFREKLEIVPFGVPPKGYTGDYAPHKKTSRDTDKNAEETMVEYLNYQGADPRVVFESQRRQQFCQLRGTYQAAQGKTWMSPMAATAAALDRLLRKFTFAPY